MIASKNQDILCYPLASRLLSRTFRHGAHIHAPTKHLTAEGFADVAPLPTDLNPPLPVQEDALKDMIRLLRRMNVQAVFVRPGLPSVLYDYTEAAEKDRLVRETVQNAGFAYVDGTVGFENGDPSNFFDGRHFSAKGRREFTEFLVERLGALELIGTEQ